MNILMLTASLSSGGVETHVCELSRSLCRQGHELTVVSSGGALTDELRRHGIRHITLSLDSRSPIKILSAARRLRRIIKSGSYDVLHTHSRIAALVCRLATAALRTPPLVVSTVHSRFRATPILKKLSFWGASSIAVSEDLRGYLSDKYGIYRDNITVIPNAIDTDVFSPHANAGKDRRAPRIIFVSRLDTDCSLGATLLCRIAPRLAKKIPNVTIELVGGGSAQRRLGSLAAKVNNELGYECISLCGFVRDVADKLRSADVFVGVSRAALEAMACALPVVLCGNEGFIGILDSSTIKAAASTNFCCRGSELPTSDSLFDAVSSLLEMKASERRELGEHLRGYVLRRHSPQATAQKTEEFYKRALSLRPAKRAQTVLCGYYGFGNVGDDAMLSSALSILRDEQPNTELSVICHDKKGTAKRFCVRTVKRENIFSVAKEIRGAKRLIFGGGSILQNASSMRSLRFYAALIRYAHKHGVTVELWANGLGPLKGRRARKITSRALARVDLLSFRDNASALLAKELGARDNAIVVEDDLASSVDPCEAERVEHILMGAGLTCDDFLLVSINKRTTKKVKKQIKKAVASFREDGLVPLFVVMHPTEDKRVCRRAAKKSRGIYLPPLTPSELAGIVTRARYAIGNRYHLLYLAKRAGVPIMGYGDDPKITSLV